MPLHKAHTEPDRVTAVPILTMGGELEEFMAVAEIAEGNTEKKRTGMEEEAEERYPITARPTQL